VADNTGIDRTQVYALHRYYLWANHMRSRFFDVLGEASARGEKVDLSGDSGIYAVMFMSYWYAGLHVVIEGWNELGLKDDEVETLLDSPNVDLLRRYRNGVFHFQPVYYDDRFVGLIRDGEDVVTWVRSLNSAFGRVFLEIFNPEDYPPSP
jgi:hypothetical protein